MLFHIQMAGVFGAKETRKLHEFLILSVRLSIMVVNKRSIKSRSYLFIDKMVKFESETAMVMIHPHLKVRR